MWVRVVRSVLFVLAAAAVNVLSAEGDVKIEVLRTLDWAGQQKEAGNFRISDEKKLKEVWQASGGELAHLPKVDFETEEVLAVFAGEKPSSGYGVEIIGVFRRPRGDTLPQIKVFYRLTKPPADGFQATVLTYPATAVVIPRFEKSEFVFLNAEEDADGRELIFQADLATLRKQNPKKRTENKDEAE
jgi:hypothetical protein